MLKKSAFCEHEIQEVYSKSTALRRCAIQWASICNVKNKAFMNSSLEEVCHCIPQPYSLAHDNRHI